jgi:hypothetical protein
MKNVYIRLCAMITATCLVNSAYGVTVELIKQNLADTSKKVFDARLYAKVFSDSNAMPWLEAVTEAGNFINDVKNNFGNAKLRDSFSDLKSLDDKLIKKIQATYKALFRNEEPNTDDLDEYEEEFQKIQKSIKLIENSINGLPHYNIPAQEETRSLLSTLATAVRNNTSKALNQIEEEIRLRKTEQKDTIKKEEATEKAEKKAAKEKRKEKELKKEEKEASKLKAEEEAEKKELAAQKMAQEKIEAEAKKEAEQIKQSLKSSNQLFDGRIYEKSFDGDDIESMVDNLARFAKKYADDEEELQGIAQQLRSDYHTLVEEIQSAYKSIFQPSVVLYESTLTGRQQDENKKLTAQKIDEIKDALDTIQSSVHEMYSNLNRSPLDFNGPQEEVRQLLRTTATTLKANISKAMDQLGMEKTRRETDMAKQQKAEMAKKQMVDVVQQEANKLRNSFVQANEAVFDIPIYTQALSQRKISTLDSALDAIKPFIKKNQGDENILTELYNMLKRTHTNIFDAINIVHPYLTTTPIGSDTEQEIKRIQKRLGQLSTSIESIVDRLNEDTFEGAQEVVRTFLLEIANQLAENVAKALEPIEEIYQQRIKETERTSARGATLAKPAAQQSRSTPTPAASTLSEQIAAQQAKMAAQKAAEETARQQAAAAEAARKAEAIRRASTERA